MTIQGRPVHELLLQALQCLLSLILYHWTSCAMGGLLLEDGLCYGYYCLIKPWIYLTANSTLDITC